MPLGVDPEAVIGYSVLLVTAFVQGLQVTQDICVGDHASLAAAQDDRGTAAFCTLNSQAIMTAYCRFPQLPSDP
jgi:hypothetical protein